MEKTKRYYWIKLKTDFFNLAEIDFLLSQKDGCQYIVLYQMLCLQTANNNGELASRVGEMIIPYDPDKIARDTKYFSKDTVIVAMELFKKLNLIYTDDGICLKLVKIMEDIREEKLASNTISGGQYARLKWTINKIKNSKIGNMKIQDITKDDIQEFLNSVKDLSDSYIKKLYEQFVQAYHRAEIKKYISYNPMYEVIKPKSNKQTKVVEALDINVQKSFTEYLNKISIEDEPYKNIFLIQMYMGLRIGEVLALSKESIDLENKVLCVRRTLTNDKEFAIILGNKTKTYSGNRTLPIPEFLVPIFEEQLKYTNENLHNLIFTNNDSYIRTSAINKELKRIFKEELNVNSKNISTHCLRHTYGTRCIEAGMTAVVLQRLMGHKDVTVTLNTYTSVFNKFKEDELEKVNTYLNNNQLNFANNRN